MRVGRIMSSPVISATAATTIRDAARRMDAHAVGALPVLRDGLPVGIVTDRDLVIRGLAARGLACGSDTCLGAIMTRPVICCLDNQDVADAAALMGERQVRRLLVIDRTGVPVGVLSVCDIAEHVSEELAGQALGEISEARAQAWRGADPRLTPYRG